MQEIVSFGAWVQTRRNQLGVSRTVLARQIGCAPVTIKKIERDERRPSEQLAELLAAQLQIPQSEQEDFIRRARGEFVPQLLSPVEMSLAEAQNEATAEELPRHNLPTQATSFIGRDSELPTIAANLAKPDCRLLTILGSGGTGKTRLAIAATHNEIGNFTDGITFVALAPIPSQHAEEANSSLTGALADALGIAFHAESAPKEQLFHYLRRKEMLLLLDNFEHLIDSAIFVGELLNNAPDLKILVTSRERLNLQEEWIFALQGLPFPQGPLSTDDESEIATLGSVQLFIKRAQQVKATFDVADELPGIVQICQLVEGMPLGLELAAAWVRQMSCTAIAKEIASELDFLTTKLRNVPERHRSIRAIFSYSWEQLSEKERSILQKLSVFRGGFERDAAKAVAGASLHLLTGLVDKSLLAVAADNRYELHELLRQFAAEHLESTPDAAALAYVEHSRYFIEFLAKQEKRLQGPDVVASLAATRRDIDNIRSAINWACEYQPGFFSRDAAITLHQFIEVQGWFLEGEKTFGQIAAACGAIAKAESGDLAARAQIQQVIYQTFQGACLWRQNQLDLAEQTIRQALSQLPSTGPLARWTRGLALLYLGIVIVYRNERELVQAGLEKCHALLKEEGDVIYAAFALIVREQIVMRIGDVALAQQLIEEVQTFLKGNEHKILNSYIVGDLGKIAMWRGEFDIAELHFQSCLTMRQELEMQTGIAFTLRDLGNLASITGDLTRAKQYLRQTIKVADEAGMHFQIAQAQWLLGNVALAEYNFETALQFFHAGGLDAETGGPGWALLGLNDLPAARRSFESSLKLILAGYSPLTGLDALLGLAHVSARKGLLEQALELAALVQHHEAVNYEIAEKARRLWEELEAELDSILVAAALERGRVLDLNETAKRLLAEGAIQ